MTDRLTELLEHAADTCSQGPAPVPPLARTGRARGARASWLAPAAAAAACVAIVLAATGLTGGRQAAPAPTSGFADVGPLVIVNLETLPREADAGLPALIPPLPDDGPVCRPQNIQAGFSPRGTLDLTLLQGVPCRLPADLGALLPPDRTRFLVQPEVPNPPVFQGERLDGTGITFSADWAGTCPAPGTVTLLAPGFSGPVVRVTGPPPGCGGTGDSELTLGPAHRTGQPGGLVPVDRAGLELALSSPGSVVAGGPLSSVLTVRNPTATPIALRPCPTFTRELRTEPGGAFGDSGRFPCEQLPEVLPSSGELTLRLDGRLPTVVPGAGAGRGSVTLTIAGARAATTSFDIAPLEVIGRVDIPYSPPPPKYAPPAPLTLTANNGVMPVQITAPTSVGAGETLRYTAVLTLPPDTGVSLSPCPAWVESFYPAPSTGAAKSAAGLVTRVGPVTCRSAPAELQPGSEVSFQMELPIPPGTEPGDYQLVWQLLSGLDSAPFDLTVTP